MKLNAFRHAPADTSFSEVKQSYDSKKDLDDAWTIDKFYEADTTVYADTSPNDGGVKIDEEFIVKASPSSLLSDDTVVINDILFSDIPVTAIGTESINDTLVSETLRNKSCIVVSKGNRTFRLSMNLVFGPGDPQYKLHRLMSQLTKNPITFIYSNVVKQRMDIDPSENTIFMLESGNIRNSSSNTGNIVLDLHFTYFNYKPFSNSFRYNGKFNGYSSENNEPRLEDNVKFIGDINSYDSSSFLVQKRAEEFLYQLAHNTNIDLSGKNNTPVDFPSQSDAWMYYADYLQSIAKDINDYTSDCIGFIGKKFKLINPTDPRARLSSSTGDDIFRQNVEYPPIKDIYKIYGITAGQRRAVEFVKAGKNKSTNRKKTANKNNEPVPVRFVYTKTGGEDYILLTDKDGKPLSAAAEKLTKLANVGKEKNATAIQPELVTVLQKIAFRFPERKILIISASRIPKHPEKFYARPIEKQSLHAHGKAVDFRVQGVPNKELFKFLRTLNGVGCGYYPNSSFCHVDARAPKKAFWVDLSKSKQPSIYLKGVKLAIYVKENNLEPGTDYGIEEVVADKTEQIEEKATQPETDNKQKQKVNEKKQDKKPKENTKKKSKEKKQLPDPTIRKQWIEKIEAETGYKYYVDPSLKNIFYKEFSEQVNSNVELQRYGIALPNIVCSSISISFGHRVAPMHVIGQDYYTYQHLGVGNKTGTIVFTYAGESGRQSAQRLKKLINLAHESSVYFNMIPESGSLGIRSVLEETDEKNTILRLLDVDNIVILKVNEYSLPEGADKHQLVIDFVVQEFAEEKPLQRELPSTSEDRINIFKTIAQKYLTTKGKHRITKKPILVVPHKRIAVGNGRHVTIKKKECVNFNSEGYSASNQVCIEREERKRVGGLWEPANDSIPLWLLKAVVDAADKLNKFNEELPPVDLNVGDKDTGTWRNIYALFGCEKLIWGYEKNAVTKVVTTGKNTFVGLGTSPGKISVDSKKRIIDKKETNLIHVDMLNEFEDILSSVADNIMTHRADEKAFRKYFPGISEQFYNQITEVFSSCYADMNLPGIPGLEEFTLPPDFYIYRDSDEVSDVTSNDKKNIERLLTNQMVNEVKSLKHYIQDCALGNNYISHNMSDAIQKRKDVQDLMSAEFFLAQENFYEGGNVWEPVYFKYDSPEYGTNAGTELKSRIEGLASNKEGGMQVTESFLDDAIRINPYIIKGRNFSNKQPETRELIEKYYGRAWAALSFGPNINNRAIDKKISGILSVDLSKDETDDLEKYKKKAKETGQGIFIPNKELFIHPDGTVTVGLSDEDWEGSRRDMIKNHPYKSTLFDMYSAFGYVETPAQKNAKENKEKIKKKRAKKGEDTDSETINEQIIKDKTKLINLLKDVNKNTNDLKDKFTSIESRYAKVAAGIAIGARENDLSMRRVFPTFKIYFIEDDTDENSARGGTIKRAFDDFYSYNSIQDIKIHESQNNPGSIAIITMTNVGGKLFNKRFGEREELFDEEKIKFGIGAEKQGIWADTNLENPFEKLILKEGVKVQIRLGYSGNPDNLATRFLGQVIEVEPLENGRLIQIVCQSYGAELDAVELAPDGDTTFATSQSALCSAIIQPSIVNFGRRLKTNMFNPAEMRGPLSGEAGAREPSLLKYIITGTMAGGFVGAIISFFSFLIKRKVDKDSAIAYEKYLYSNQFINFPQDDNIYAPPPWFYVNNLLPGVPDFLDVITFKPQKQSTWDIFKEHELRHPGFISYAVPYGHEPRMTMFFGSKTQHYWSRPPTKTEIQLSTKAYNEIARLRGISYDKLEETGYLNKIKSLAKTNLPLAQAILKDLALSSAPTNSAREIGRMLGRYIPFRGYHFADSRFHILKNNIHTSIDGTFNHVEIDYSGGTYSVKLDENIPENNLRTFRQEFPACPTEDMAKRYAQGLFVIGLKNMYKGELVLVGNENIKPYDIIHINDNVNQMYGPAEVKSVTHLINRDTGYVTIVEPGMCVETSDLFTTSFTDLMMAAFHWSMGKENGKLTPSQRVKNAITPINIPGAANNASIVGNINFLAGIGAVALIHWLQDGYPVSISPLIFRGRPFVSISVGLKAGSMFAKEGGRWAQYKEDTAAGWDKFDFSESFADFQRGLFEDFVDPYESF